MPEEEMEKQQSEDRVEELRKQLEDPEFIKSLYEKGKALVEGGADSEDVDGVSDKELDALLASLEDEAGSGEPPQPQKVSEVVSSVVDKKVSAVKRELEERLEAEKALLTFRQQCPDVDEYMGLMLAIAHERPDLDKPGVEGLRALYEEAKSRVKRLGEKLLLEEKQKADAVSSEKPSAPGAGTPAPKSFDELLQEAVEEWKSGGKRELLGGL